MYPIIVSFMFYILIGALVFSKVEGWNYLDAVYWADFTLLTVGIGGEYVPKTHTGRSLLFFYAIGGILMVGLVIGSIRSLILEHGKEKISARFMEMKREKVIANIDKEKRTVKLGPFEKMTFSEKGLQESQRREQEFRVMRRIQQKAERKRRYTALAMSSTAAFLLWSLGAVVFMYSEKSQGWSYFVSLYFAYTSLLTIGYGDYTLSSNSGKAFFVFWSLMAVPTLTILISNMGDTVIKGFRDLSLWIGSLTVLPDEQGLSSKLSIGMKRLRFGNLISPQEEEGEGTTGASEQKMLDRFAEHVDEDELEHAEEAGEHGDYLERDIRFYHYVLAREVRMLMRDLNASPPRQYTYQEWYYYLRLIGQDEDNATEHRKAKIHHERKDDSQPEIGTADDGENNTWSWLGVRSPLMGTQNEAQWLLQRLLATLEREMLKLRSPDAKKEPPPISMADLKNRKGSETSKGERVNAVQKDLGAAEIRRRGRNGGGM
jgi:potassium channel subfamily K